MDTPTPESLRAQQNNPNLAGKNASNTFIFGKFERYALYAVHGAAPRQNKVMWFVEDAETPDEFTGLPTSIIRQAWTIEEALQGFDF